MYSLTNIIVYWNQMCIYSHYYMLCERKYSVWINGNKIITLYIWNIRLYSWYYNIMILQYFWTQNH